MRTIDDLKARWRSRSGGASRAPAVGDMAPPLAGTTLDGDSFRLAGCHHPMLVVFLRHAG